ncbi:MAG TPA: carboxyltransferase domain-containing protein [Thermoanaerobaculia bacterium]|nr:carboxyltransferase domain-containing protein [Thermoanaerobaculia bacterium]
MTEIAPAGDRALMVTMDDLSAEVLHAHASRLRSLDGVLASIAGERSILVIHEPGALGVEGAIRGALASRSGEATLSARAHRIDVNFGDAYGPDLDEILAKGGLSRDAFLRGVADLRLTARYLGFRAGFAYLDGWPDAWALPRRPTSRVRVPGGTFAIAGTRAGFYPVDSPGGWNLLGRTDAALWDPSSDPPILIEPGDTVMIVPTEREILARPEPAMASVLDAPLIAEVVQPGQLTQVVSAEDWSRSVYGLPAGGPFDLEAAALANRAVGNAADAPLLECVMVGPQLRFERPAEVSWSGAAADLKVDGSSPADPRRFAVRAGATLAVGRIRGGLRGWLAVTGGIDVPRMLYGQPPPLRRGALYSASSRLSEAIVASLARGEIREIRAIAGPHPVSPRELDAIAANEWEVTPQIDRVGIRLRPTDRIEAEIPANLPSCGMQCGSVQWHPDGSIIVMGPDHPVTGGYLQPVTVASEERWKLAQLAPGMLVRWRIERERLTVPTS